MKTETRKLAGIATVLWGGLASLGAGAVEQSASAIAAGAVAGLDSVPLAGQSAYAMGDQLVTRDAKPADAITQAVADAMSAKEEAQPLAETRRAIDSMQTAMPAQKSKTPLSYAAPIAVPQAAHRAATPAVQRANDNEDPSWPSAATVAISEERLDSMRGGFDTASGLKISFGISRMAVVNGNLVTQTSFNIPDLSNITTQQAQALAAANTGSLLQNGASNVVQQGALPSLSGAVIQNSLSNQNIQALTTINASVNSLSLFKNLNLGATLNNALMSAVRGR
jgi:hypothetical protein